MNAQMTNLAVSLGAMQRKSASFMPILTTELTVNSHPLHHFPPQLDHIISYGYSSLSFNICIRCWLITTVARKVPFENPDVLLAVRVGYVVVQLIVLAVHYYVSMKVSSSLFSSLLRSLTERHELDQTKERLDCP